MPRRRKRAAFEIGKFWLSTIPQRRGYYAFWTDSGNGGTRRQSLGTEDIEEAKLKLAEVVLRGAPAGATTPFAIVLENYFVERTDKLPSKVAARHAGELLLEHWGANAKAQDVTVDRQKEFAEASAQRGHSLGYISRNLSVASAALHHAGMQVKIITSEEFMRDGWKIAAKAPRRVFIPTDHELAGSCAPTCPVDLDRWLLISMSTACRPQAAIDLAPAARIRDAQALDLNPAGRAQNKKPAHFVRAPKFLTTALNRWERAGLDKHGGRYCGYHSVDSVDSALERVCKRPDVN